MNRSDEIQGQNMCSEGCLVIGCEKDDKMRYEKVNKQYVVGEKKKIYVCVIYRSRGGKDRNDHTTMTAPLPVCSAKLSIVGPGQYYGGGPRWNPRCCSFAFLALLLLLFTLLGSEPIHYTFHSRHCIILSSFQHPFFMKHTSFVAFVSISRLHFNPLLPTF